MSEPEPVFTSWKPWAQRGNIGNAGGPGVYLLAHIPQGQVPAGPASPLDEHIVYIGETHRQTLGRRWSDFDRSARTGNRGHAGGRTYHKRFGTIQGNLYVAAYTPEQSDWTRSLPVLLPTLYRVEVGLGLRQYLQARRAVQQGLISPVFTPTGDAKATFVTSTGYAAADTCRDPP